MAAQASAALTGNLGSKPVASDLFRSSRNGVSGITFRPLGRAQFGVQRRDFTISAKIRKWKKHDYPWPADPDPSVKGGILSHLSPFKPLTEKPKPVTLAFEKPLLDLQKKIVDVQKMANETGLDFSDQIISLENKYQQALKDLYTHLTPIQRVNIARHPNRPTFLDHIFNITEKFVELHGDRCGYDDPAIVCGLGTINGKSYMFIGHQKGRNTKENVKRNFGMPTPHGYRKAMRMMYYADHHGFPIVTFVDTPGAYADLKSEELGQGEAIAHNLRTMFGLKVPIVSIIIGEGGSGGALAIACANKLLMLENAVFYVASPEACAAILWKSAKASPKAAEKLRITATELCNLQIADGVIPEPLGGAHADSHWTSLQIKDAILNAMEELEKMDIPDLLKHRSLKFRKIGGFQEGIPIDPIKKANMKKKEIPVIQPGQTPVNELKDEVEKLKESILSATGSSEKKPGSGLKEMIEKLKTEVDYEYSEAAKALGFEEKLMLIRQELDEANSANDQTLTSALTEKIDKLKQEFNQSLPSAPNYPSLKYKLGMLAEMSTAQRSSGDNSKAIELKLEINKRFKELTERADIKQKFEALQAEIESSGMTESVKEKFVSLKDEVDQEFSGVLKSLGLQVNPNELLEAKEKLEGFNAEIQSVMEDVIGNSDLKDEIELLKMEVANAGKTPSEESKAKIQALEQHIKKSLADAMNNSLLRDRHEKLLMEISDTVSSEETNGSLTKESKVMTS